MDLDLPQPKALPLSDLTAAVHRAAEATAALSSPSSSSHAAAAAVAALRDAHAAIGSFLSRLDAAASDQPMSDGGEEEEQMVGEVEEGIREWGLQGTKRRKRPVPPSWPIGRRAGGGVGEVLPAMEVAERRRAAMDLLFQFHA